MKQHLRHIYLTACAIGIALSAMAQSHPECPLDTIQGQIYYKYTVEKGIGLYRLSVNFGVSQEDILCANPDLQNRGMRYGEVLRIPAKDLPLVVEQKVEVQQPVAVEKPVAMSIPVTQVVEEKQPVAVVEQERIVLDKPAVLIPVDTIVKDTLVAGITAEDSVITDTNPIRIAIMLPFYTQAVKRDKEMERFYDFYAGALLAVNEVQAEGQHIEIYTYDVGKTAYQVTNILNNPQIPHFDAIIGPVYSTQVTAAAEYAKRDSTLLLVPFISKVEGIDRNPYILQFNPSEETEADTLARYLAQRGDSVNCVFIEAKEGELVPASVMKLQQSLVNNHVPTTITSIRAILQDSLAGVLKPDVENIFLFNTERYGNLQVLLPHLSIAAQSYPITLFSHYSWQKQNIPFPQIYTSVFSNAPYIPEYYEEAFRQYFGHTLSSTNPRYDLLGYDLTRHILHIVQSLQADGNADLSHVITEDQMYGTQSNVRYKRVGENGGYENDNIHIIRK